MKSDIEAEVDVGGASQCGVSVTLRGEIGKMVSSMLQIRQAISESQAHGTGIGPEAASFFATLWEAIDSTYSRIQDAGTTCADWSMDNADNQHKRRGER